jgi:hypothetical protein
MSAATSTAHARDIERTGLIARLRGARCAARKVKQAFMVASSVASTA